MYHYGYGFIFSDDAQYYDDLLFDVMLDLAAKAFKVSGECIMLILFEVWKLSLALDGVRHSNSRTMWASASFTIFSFGFSILMITEYIKWIEVGKEVEIRNMAPEWVGELKRTNLNLLIALSCISFLIIPATFYTAVKVAKDFGWDAYKKIGSSIKIQKDWHAIAGFCSASLIAAIGLKEFVQWKPFSRKTPKRQSAIYSTMSQVDRFDGLEAQRAEEPIDD
ncbi:hypothetical protein INT48_006090 [Thamnidium elegans]|uniref:Uncharacterized protein n=1 Tax=Thamnidium elegans TaxID=101142 RepID=A0A8H7SV12_9FUNG|nr:hypothetical protein INT48_006090 [Thamnidium elegans]